LTLINRKLKMTAFEFKFKFIYLYSTFKQPLRQTKVLYRTQKSKKISNKK